MAGRIHLICRDRLGLRRTDAGKDIYESEAWDLSPAEVAALEGGRIFFHQTKAEPSYFGGDILGARRIGEENPQYCGRVVFTLRSTAEARGAPWEGKAHGMAWSGGVMED